MKHINDDDDGNDDDVDDGGAKITVINGVNWEGMSY